MGFRLLHSLSRSGWTGKQSGVLNLRQGLPSKGTSPKPADVANFKVQAPSPHPSADETPRQLLISPVVQELPCAEASLSITPYVTEPLHGNRLSVRTLPATDTPISPFDVCETPKQGSRLFNFPALDVLLPHASLQPPHAPRHQRNSTLDHLHSARASTPSPGPDSGMLLVGPLDARFPDSAAEGSVGGWQTEDASPTDHKLEPSLCNSFHAAEELAGQFATMQVCCGRLSATLSLHMDWNPALCVSCCHGPIRMICSTRCMHLPCALHCCQAFSTLGLHGMLAEAPCILPARRGTPFGQTCPAATLARCTRAAH
jgi:hypothetical protein